MAAADERALSAFPAAAQILLTTILFGSVVDASATSGFDTVKIPVQDLADAILGDFQYTTDLQTNNKTIFGAINNLRVLSGTATPTSATGTDGQFYVKYTVDGNDDPDAVTGLYFKAGGDWLEISTGGGGGSATLAGLTDVDITSPTDGQSLVYNETTGKWENGDGTILTPIPVTSQMVTDSSHVDNNFAGAKAFDGQSCNISTMQGGWLATANDNTPTLTVNFGTAKSLGRIAIETANNNNPDTVRDIYIEGSNDGSTWENILASGSTASLTFENGSYREYTFELNEGNYQYFRIRGTQPFFGGSFQYACCFSEVILYDKTTGVQTIEDLTDVDITSPADGQLLRYNGTSGKWENAGIINDTTASTSSVYSSKQTDTLLSTKQALITTVSHSITPAASSTISPFSYYGEYNFSSEIGNKTVLSVVIEGGGSNNAHTYSFVSKRVRIYANANDELTVTLFLI